VCNLYQWLKSIIEAFCSLLLGGKCKKIR